MTIKTYHPSDADLARWRQEMQSWQGVTSYRERISAQYSNVKNPTLSHVKNAVVALGPDHPFSGMKPEDVHPFTHGNGWHDILHGSLNFAPIPQQEQWLMPVSQSFHLGVEGCMRSNAHDFKRLLMEDAVNWWGTDVECLKNPDTPQPVLDARKFAVGVAQGLYLSDKVRQCGPQSDRNFAEQQQIAREYADNDTIPKNHEGFSSLELLNYKNAEEIATLSPQEMRAITAVATGLQRPEETSYPKRLERIEKVLHHLKLQHDMKPWAQKLADAQQIQQTVTRR